MPPAGLAGDEGRVVLSASLLFLLAVIGMLRVLAGWPHLCEITDRSEFVLERSKLPGVGGEVRSGTESGV